MNAFRNRRGGMHWGWFVGIGCLVIVIGIAVFIVAAVLPAFKEMKKGSEPLAQCGTQLEQIATALKGYSAAHGGAYPPNLAALSPTYLKDPKALTCPETKGARAPYEYVIPPRNAPADFIVVRCSNHTMFGQNIGLVIQKDGQAMTDTRASLDKSGRHRAGISVKTGSGD